MKIRTDKLNKENKEKYLDTFYSAIELAKTRNEMKSFLSDILTESEKVMLGRRLMIAKRLLVRMPRDQIVQEVGVGLDTVYRVQKWLGGRHLAYMESAKKIKKIPKLNKSGSGFRDYYQSGPFADIKRKYKTYYWLSDLLEELNV